jgi:hypothetical protein
MYATLRKAVDISALLLIVSETLVNSTCFEFGADYGEQMILWDTTPGRIVPVRVGIVGIRSLLRR